LQTDQNIDWLAGLLSLDTASQRVLSLAAAVEIGTIDREVFAHIQRPARRDQALRVALGLDSDQAAAQATRRRSPLLRTGILERACNDLADVLKMTPIGSALVTSRFKSVDDMAVRVLRPLKPSSADMVLHWPHLQDRSDLLAALMTNALATKARGINLLLYGAPGTGKTEYAKQLVETVGAVGFEIDDKTDDEAPASRDQRLGHLRLSELFAPAGRSILLLDEAEDVFQVDYHSPLRGAMGEESDSKSWMNRVLEDNASPVVWISNKIDQIDPAYLRRFTYCLEFPVMPLTVRREIARAHLAPAGCSDAFIDAMASHPNLSPALFSSAARFVGLSRPRSSPDASRDPADAAARHILMGHLHAMGDKPMVAVPSSLTRFDMSYLHVQGGVQPDEVVSTLQRVGKGTLLLG
ncbi:MAG: AAA family ATPase, partial [Comamonadaceae bacterium]